MPKLTRTQENAKRAIEWVIKRYLPENYRLTNRKVRKDAGTKREGGEGKNAG